MKKLYILGGIVLLAGCTSLPERKLENAFRYQRLKKYAVKEQKPIRSEYHDLADKAWGLMESGGTEQYVSILELGDDALLARIHLIRSAERAIDLQTFIWKDDPSSRFVFDELLKAAERGILVRLLIDSSASIATPEQLARMARAHRNLEICLFKPLKDRVEYGRIGFLENLTLKTRHMNRRMHNKLLLVDSRIGITGGRNYQSKYFDREPADYLFRDRDVLVAGPAALDMQDSFELFWQDKQAIFLTQMKDVQVEFEKLSNGAQRLSHPDDAWMFEEIDRLADEYSITALRPSLKIYEADRVRFVYDTPRKFEGGKQQMDYDEYAADLLLSGRKQLVFQTPYLIYSREQRKGFKKIRKKYPEFRIIASSNSLAAADHLSVYAISFKHRKELYKKTGIDIYEAKPYPEDRFQYVYGLERLIARQAEQALVQTSGAGGPPENKGPLLCIHAKSFVLDSRVAMIGSHNFDPRSAKLNTECGVFIEDEDVAMDLEKLILNACEPQNAWTASRGPTTPVISHFSGLIGAVSTALPVFDIWPYRYTTNYELNEGSEPLAPRDPDFQQNYTDVGYFPEVPETSRVIQTRLMKAFFGWARPLM